MFDVNLWDKAHKKLLSGGIDIEDIPEIKRVATFSANFADRISLGLAFQLLNEGPSSSVVNSALFEIEHLESGTKTTTKLATTFKRSPLKGLWHKHFFVTENFLRNVGDRWNISRGRGNSDLDKMINEVAGEYGHDHNLWPGVIAHRFILGAIEERSSASRMTGDWIIFGKHEGANYYLRLATHEQAEKNSGELFQKIKDGSVVEFPFLFDN